MAKSSEDFIVDVDENSFEKEVLEKSSNVPVLVDFWAPWCAPCRTLGPILEKLAVEYKGAFLLAKVNTDESPRLSVQYGIQGIPNVMLFRDGKTVDQFVGAYPEASIRKFLDPYCPSEADKLYTAAQQELESGLSQQAEETLRKVLKIDSAHSAARLALSKLLITSRRGDEALVHIDAIPAMADEYESAVRLKEALAFQSECQQADGESTWRQRIENDPKDLDARFGLASCLAVSGNFREALQEFLEIVARNKRYRDEAARKSMLAIFSLIGERSELADEFRTRLARALY
jgi:putative thioredoxin